MNVSVIVATYGASTWEALADARAIPSLIDSGYTELIVNHEREGTLAATRNNAVARAPCDFLCFLDADDELDVCYFDAMKAAFEAWDIHHYRGNMDRRCYAWSQACPR